MRDMTTTTKSGPDRGRLKQVLDRPVTLVGMMGSGKTIIGKKLAQELDLPFIDSDARIVETAGISIAEIFEIAGEDKFAAEREKDYGKAHITVKTDGLSAWSTTLSVLSALDTHLAVT
jgi:cytidylate kinase